ncbi:MAG: 3-oxoacyl-ACP synthase III [Candidatus Eremiobacteraeota bacterium]|nr:3-oxoacyl-ACP synthase III [Candidatus Eremiobacteraeota bacterium]
MLHSDVCLESVAYELPPNVVSMESTFEELDPLLERLRIPPAGVMAASGVEERRFWDRGTTIAEVATKAAVKAIDQSGIDPSDLGCIISTSVCKDYIEPSMASLVHGRLGLPSHCLNFDIGNACLAFMNGMSVLADMIEKGQIKAALLVDAESAREVIEATVDRLLLPETTSDQFRDNFAALTLGSGAVAAVLTHSSLSKTGHRVVGHVSLADTTHSDLCLGQQTEMIVYARPLMEAGVGLARRTWKEAARVFGWTSTNVDLFVCHQVGRRHHQFLFESLGLNEQNSFVTYPFLGNVGPASVPLTLALARDRGRLKPGFRVALMGIGSGLNCSMMELRW